MNHRPKASWSVRIAWIVVLLPILYCLSFAPACWIFAQADPCGDITTQTIFGTTYQYVGIALIESPLPVRNAVYWLVELGMPRDVVFDRPSEGVVMLFPGCSYTLVWY